MEVRRNLNPFVCKQFEIKHQLSTLAVGTDAILLASFTDCSNTNSIIDIGTGCGIIALALAQKCTPKACIEAIDLDKPSVIESAENFKNSKWANQLKATHTSFLDWHGPLQDLIVSNPPFFRNSLVNPSVHKQIARHQEDFSMIDFAQFCFSKSTAEGKICLIYPASDQEYLITIFENVGLFLSRVCTVYPKRKKEKSRIMIEFTKHITRTLYTELVVYDDDNKYTEEYKKFTKEYYLHF